MQRAGDRVRITSQLIDATTDYHMWSENYDRDLEDIFALQDEITMKLIKVMGIKMVWGEQAEHYDTAITNDIEAFDKLMHGFESIQRFSKEGNIRARKYCYEVNERS